MKKTVSALSFAVWTLLLIGIIAAFFRVDKTGGAAWAIYRINLLAQTTLVIALAIYLTARLPKSSPWPLAGKLTVAGLVLSFGGDFVNSRLVDLTFILDVQTLLSIPFFGLAHVCYILMFFAISRPVLKQRPTLFRTPLIITPVIAIGLWAALVPRDQGGPMVWMTLAYTFLVVGMGCCSIWPAKAYPKGGLLTTVGALLFVVSDALLGAALPGQPPWYLGWFVWGSYLVGQLLIARTLLLAFTEGSEGFAQK